MSLNPFVCLCVPVFYSEVFHKCFKSVSKVFQKCFESVSKVFRKCFKAVCLHWSHHSYLSSIRRACLNDMKSRQNLWLLYLIFLLIITTIYHSLALLNIILSRLVSFWKILWQGALLGCENFGIIVDNIENSQIYNRSIQE